MALDATDRAQALTLLLNEDNSTAWVGWQVLRAHPMTILSVAREAFLVASFTADKNLRDGIFSALNRHLPKGQYQVWRDTTEWLRYSFSYDKRDSSFYRKFWEQCDFWTTVLLRVPAFSLRYQQALQCLGESRILREAPSSLGASARVLLTQYLVAYPEDAAIWKALGALYFTVLDMPCWAVFCLQRAFSIDEGQLEHLEYTLYQCYRYDLVLPQCAWRYFPYEDYFQQNNTTSVIEDEDLHFHCYYERTLFYLDIGEAEKAAEAFNQLLPNTRKWAKVRLLEGRLLGYQKKCNAALQLLERLLGYHDQKSDFWGEKAYLYHRGFKRPYAAVSYYEKALAYAKWVPHRYLFLLLIACTLDAPQPERALKHYATWQTLPAYLRDGTGLPVAERAALSRAIAQLEEWASTPSI